MFEQALAIERNRPNGIWALAAMFGQAALVGLVLLAPLIAPGTISLRVILRDVLSPPLPPPPPPGGPETAARGPSGGGVVSTLLRRVFVEPVRIPAGVPEIIDQLGPPVITGGTDVPGTSGGAWGVPGGTGDRALSAPPPKEADPPPPRERPMETKPQRITVGGLVQQARAIHQPIPVYPPLARQARVDGTVKLQAIIARDGTVQQLKVISGHPLLIPAAVEAVRRCVYRPTLLNGEPVEVVAPIDVNFRLSQ